MRDNFVALIQTENMLTREQIEEIQTESREKGIPVKNLLKEKGIPDHQYFWWKRKYSRQEVPEGFFPVAEGGLSATIPSHISGSSLKGRSKSDASSDTSGKMVACRKVNANRTDNKPTQNECN